MRSVQDLAGRGLLVPQVQAEPLPIKAVEPAPCTRACPAGINVKAYVSLIGEGRFAEALAVVRERCPLPAICGRVCHHPCEAVCERRSVDEPIAIRALKRFVADLGIDSLPPPPRPAARREAKVAVVGSGPAGLTAAWDLTLAGYPVTVFEGNDEPGGMLRYGISEYRLPRPVLEAEVEAICRAGVEIRTGVCIGVHLGLEELLEQEYVATLFAVGAQRGKRLGLQGEETCRQVEDALAFLRRVNEGRREPVEGKVVVIGGGSTAVEAARSSLRLGAESVDILYRRYREELLADAEEIRAAEAEGIGFRFLVTPTRVLMEDGRLRALECMRVGLGEPDGSGRRRPITIPGSEFTVAADRVLAAVGQEAELEFLPEAFAGRLTDRGLLRTDPRTAMTAWRGVFAAGDAVSGPATVIEAIADGHRAAGAIARFLEQGRPEVPDQHPETRAAVELELPDTWPLESARARPTMRRLRHGREFEEVEPALAERAAVDEARRCLRCGPCGECRICAPSCRRRHVMMRMTGNGDHPPQPSVLLRAPGSIAMHLHTASPTPARLLGSAQPRQLHDIGPGEGEVVELLPVRASIQEALCRACGRCVEVCPFHAIQAADSQHQATAARIESALCRGCNLCASVCPTGAARPTALSPEWWGSRLEDAFHPVGEPADAPGPFVVLACQRRAGAVEDAMRPQDAQVEVIRFRCVGQIDAGMLLDLQCLGARAVLVAGCTAERCRFGCGASLAAEQIDRAQALTQIAGGDPSTIQVDWSGERGEDPLATAVARMLTARLSTPGRKRAQVST